MELGDMTENDINYDRCVLSGSKIVFLPIYPKIRTTRIPSKEPQLSMITSRTEQLRPLTKYW